MNRLCDGGSAGVSRLFPVAVVLMVVSCAVLAPSFAAGIEVQVARPRLEGNQIISSIKVPGLLDKKAIDRLASGNAFETEIRFYLLGGRELFPDERLDLRNVRISAIFNAFTGEYVVNRTVGRRPFDARTVRSLDELRTLVEVLDDVPVFDVAPEWRGRKVFIRVRAFLGVDYVFGVVPTEVWTDKTSSSRFVIP